MKNIWTKFGFVTNPNLVHIFFIAERWAPVISRLPIVLAAVDRYRNCSCDGHTPILWHSRCLWRNWPYRTSLNQRVIHIRHRGLLLLLGLVVVLAVVVVELVVVGLLLLVGLVVVLVGNNLLLWNSTQKPVIKVARSNVSDLISSSSDDFD